MRPTDYTNYGLAQELKRQPNYNPTIIAEVVRRLLAAPYQNTLAAAPQAPAAPAMPYTHVTPDCEDAGLLWAEIHHLRAAVQGPDGFASWQEAATAERVKRVAAERVAAGLPAVPTPWLPYLSDRADGVRGHYAIARHNPAGYREVWSLRTHRWASASDGVLTLDEALALLQKLTIPTAAPAAPAEVELMQALSDLVNALRERHYGRMPEEVQAAYDKAWAIVFAGPSTTAAPAAPAVDALPTVEAFGRAVRMALRERLERKPPRYLSSQQAEALMGAHAVKLQDCYAAAQAAAKGEA